MGLDMYLEVNSHSVANAGCRALGWDTSDCEWYARHGYCAYWRKANQIHRWFVENVQDGNDDCDEHFVTVEKLKNLLDDVKKVLQSTKLVDGNVTNGYTYRNGRCFPNVYDGKMLEDSSVAKAVLPTFSGFFFGGTDYDQYYWEDLQYTERMLESVLAEVRRDDDDTMWVSVDDPDFEVKFRYSSSW